MVSCSPDFSEQSQVVNGFSELMVDVFGDEKGKEDRRAVRLASLAGNQPVEIEVIFEVST